MFGDLQAAKAGSTVPGDSIEKSGFITREVLYFGE